MSLFYSYQLTSLDAQKYFPNYVHHPFLHRLNASLSICFPIYIISFPYQTQNLLGGKNKNKNKNKNSLCCSQPSSCCWYFITPTLEIFSYLFIYFNYSKIGSDNHNLKFSEFQQSSVIIIIIIIIVQKSHKVFDCTVVS